MPVYSLLKVSSLLMAITYVHHYSLLLSLQPKFFATKGCKNERNAIAMAYNPIIKMTTIGYVKGTLQNIIIASYHHIWHLLLYITAEQLRTFVFGGRFYRVPEVVYVIYKPRQLGAYIKYIT